jgi:Predicted AAA-ATPase/PD-(D/E)XK nuclease superfamily
MRLPIGYDNFKDLIDKRLDFVDKTLWIKEILDDPSAQVSVITRPRRFGKTLNLSMLHCFLASKVYGQPTQGLFTGLKIAQAPGDYLQYQGKYPVVFITFKDVKDHEYTESYANLVNLMAKVYKEHYYLLSSPHLTKEDKQIFHAILSQTASKSWIKSALEKLTQFLYQHHGVKPWLLIDEYDSPLQTAYLHGYYDEMIDLFRGIFAMVLKTNPYLERAVITGILRISKESLFSGLNNLKVYSVLSARYSPYFGLTEEEVSKLLQKAGLKRQEAEIREWYNGYQMGETTIYNPWSLVNCIQEGGITQPYWVNTSDNWLIQKLLTSGNESFRVQFEDLLRGESLLKVIDENVVFGDLKKDAKAAWSMLLMAGYLKVVEQHYTDEGTECTLTIPNREVRSLYHRIIKSWLADGEGLEWFNQFLEHLLKGNVSKFEADLKHLVEETFSVHDTSRDPEVFYHGFMVGVTASLYHHENYEIKSNRESGYGRYDYMIFSHDDTRPTILLEIKRVRVEDKKEKAQLEQLLSETAQQAVAQMEQQRYWAEARQRGKKNLLKLGLAFCGKHFKIWSVSEKLI